MSEPARTPRNPAVQLKAVGEAREEIQGVAGQALEWLKVSEQRVAAAEARNEKVREQLKERALGTMRKFSAEAKAKVESERGARLAAEAKLQGQEAKVAAAEGARDRAEKNFEEQQQSADAERERLMGQVSEARTEAEAAQAEARNEAQREVTEARLEIKAEIEKQVKQASERIQAEADRKIAAAEQRAAEAERASEESHETAVRIETEIERRVMEGTEEVRREAEESVRRLVARVEGEAEEAARARAEDQVQAETDRLRVQNERRAERVRAATEDEVKASVSRARREAQAAAQDLAPSWLQREESSAPTAGYRTF